MNNNYRNGSSSSSLLFYMKNYSSNIRNSLILSLIFLLVLLPDFHRHFSSSLRPQNPLVSANRVIELTDKHLELILNGQRSYLIKFYVSWCHHCNELAPVWEQVAQQLHSTDTNIYVGKIECQANPKAAQFFGIRGYPTIMFVNAQKRIEFKGERTLPEIIDFATRVSGPPIRYLSSCDQVDDLTKQAEQHVAFVNFGPDIDADFNQAASGLQQFDWFYRSLITCKNFDNGVYVIKANGVAFKYDPTKDGEMAVWIKRNRLPHFAKITTANLHVALFSHDYLVLAIVEEYHNRQANKLVDQKNIAFRALVEAWAYTYHNRDRKYQFGWITDLATINSIVMHSVPVPSFLVLNTSNIQYYYYEGDLSQEGVFRWFDDIATNPDGVKSYGGDRWHHRMFRLVYDTVTTVWSMYRGQPTLTLLMFGLPTAFFSIIIYVSCCSDMLDAKDEDLDDEEEEEEERDEDGSHEKRE